MKVENKILVISLIVSSLVFLAIMIGFDFFEGKGFDIKKYAIQAVLFGLLMGYFNRWSYKNKNKKKE